MVKFYVMNTLTQFLKTDITVHNEDSTRKIIDSLKRLFVYI